MVSPRAEMTKTQNWRPTPFMDPVRNREIIREERPGGISMPLLNPDLTPIRRKQYDEQHHQITSTLRSIRGAA